MTELNKERLKEVKDYLNTSGLLEEHKDGLRGLLELTASVANGHPDKIQGICDVLLAMTINEVRKEIRLPGRINDAVKFEMATHVAACPMRGATSSMPKWLMMTYPFRWQLAILLSVLAFAPEAPAIFNAIIKAWK